MPRMRVALIAFHGWAVLELWPAKAGKSCQGTRTEAAYQEPTKADASSAASLAYGHPATGVFLVRVTFGTDCPHDALAATNIFCQATFSIPADPRGAAGWLWSLSLAPTHLACALAACAGMPASIRRPRSPIPSLKFSFRLIGYLLVGLQHAVIQR